jgi:pimeloyl-ACP methyl ester carboxylesterase
LLLGHSDGASIAAIYAGGRADHRVRGLALIAPHFVVEDVSVTSIAEIRQAYESTELRAKLARWHSDVDNAFHGWNGAWLDPKFRDWDITEYLAYIRVPVAIVQGADDQYGTMLQVEIAREECYCPVDATILPGVGHSPHREAPEATLNAISEFARRILDTHEGAKGPMA